MIGIRSEFVFANAEIYDKNLHQLHDFSSKAAEISCTVLWSLYRGVRQGKRLQDKDAVRGYNFRVVNGSRDWGGG